MIKQAIINATTPEQSGELLRLGLDPGTADMVWHPLDDGRWVPMPRAYCDHDPFIEYDEEDLCWSLDALLGVIPSLDGIDVALRRVGDGQWRCVWNDTLSRGEKDFTGTPIDAACAMVTWLLHVGLIIPNG